MRHTEMICAMIAQLLDGVSVKELEEHGLTANYAEHGKGIYPADSFGIPFNIADIAEDIAADDTTSFELQPHFLLKYREKMLL